MAKAFTFELQGYEKLVNELSKKSSELAVRVDAEIQDSAEAIRGKAVRRAVANFGGGSGLRSGIGIEPSGKLSWTVYSSKDYSAYVEFGTGSLVEVPVGLEEYALQFKADPKVRDVNLPASPFFFNSYEEERKKLIETLKKVLGTL